MYEYFADSGKFLRRKRKDRHPGIFLLSLLGEVRERPKGAFPAVPPLLCEFYDIVMLFFFCSRASPINRSV